MKKVLKVIGYLILILVCVAVIGYLLFNEARPTLKHPAKADVLATKMLNALHVEQYKNTEVLEFTFRGVNHYKWYKNKGIVEVSWGDKKVILNTKNTKISKVFINNIETEDANAIATAQHNFNNDSFWLIAPFKVFDKGTKRGIVTTEDGKEALLVSYSYGGSTPGDAYLWLLDDNYLPTAFKMWTRIIPIGGVKATWANWTTTDTGFKLAKTRNLAFLNTNIPVTNIKTYNKNADAFASKILKAINHNAYKNTQYLEWSFANKRFFKWDKTARVVKVTWDSVSVNLYPNNLTKSSIITNTKTQKQADSTVIKKAWHLFNNDSFWLVAPHKLFDNGTIRTLETKNNKQALRVTYTSGGSTPGDAYVWFVDQNYQPTHYKMYLANKRLNGVTATWQDWVTTKSGTRLPTNHVFENGNTLSMGKVKGYN